jgi:hypothetical protein
LRATIPILLILLLAAAAPLAAQESQGDGSGRPEVDDAPSEAPPEVDNSAEGPAWEPLPPPLPRPPPGLEDAAGSPADLAREHLVQGEVLDALGIRVARRLEARDLPCDARLAGLWELSLVQREAADRVDTARAYLESDDASEPAEVLAALGDRLLRLRARLDDLAAGTPRLRRGGCAGEAAAPLFLTDRGADGVGGRAAILARAATPSAVVWVDGRPVALTAEDGWALLVVPEGTRSLCAAPAQEPSCAQVYEVEARMGAAFDLR